MPRPRFHSLAPTQQQLILDAAFAEFSAHGYASASLNRIIREAGISKGSMYYYFDDKHDLYAEVVRAALSRLVQEAPQDGPGGPDSAGGLDGRGGLDAATDPDGFWLALEQHAVRLVAHLSATPGLLELLRGALDQADAIETKQGVEHMMMPWLEQTLELGQTLGAVRTDLPAELLIAVALGMGRAIDAWLLARAATDPDVTASVPQTIGLIRGALSP
ncbi:TetR/AcrR family transcriptional regulator [Salana multivorans]